MANRNVIRVIHIRIMYCTRRKYKINMAHCANFARFIFISSVLFFCILLDRKATTTSTLCAHYALCSHRARSAICTESFSALSHARARSLRVYGCLCRRFSARSIVSFCDSPLKIENLIDLRPEQFTVHKSKLRIRSLRLAKQRAHTPTMETTAHTSQENIFQSN